MNDKRDNTEKLQLSFGKALRLARQYHGLSQAALANKAGVSQRLICNWEDLDQLPGGFDLGKVKQVARVLGLNPGDLVHGWLPVSVVEGPRRDPRQTDPGVVRYVILAQLLDKEWQHLGLDTKQTILDIIQCLVDRDIRRREVSPEE